MQGFRIGAGHDEPAQAWRHHQQFIHCLVPNSPSTKYEYSRGKVSSVKWWDGSTEKNLATNITYAPMGPMTGFTYGNGLVRDIGYDTNGRRTSTKVIGATGIQNLTHGYDTNNRMTTLINGVNSSLSQTFGYDELSRLNSVTSASGNWGYTYDENGNRMTHSLGGSTTNYVTPAGSNRLANLTGATARSYVYDNNGNVTSMAGKTFTYDVFNRLRTATIGATTVDYRINAVGQRMYKRATAGGSVVQSVFAYDPSGAIVVDYDTVNGLSQFAWLGGEPIAVMKANVPYFIHGDHLGRPEAVTNQSKAVVWRASNQAFDSTVTLDGFGGLNLGFPGQIRDAETGTWYNGFRDYHPVTGRYLQSDPIGLAGGLNTYGYVGGNPVSLTDPLGLESPQYSLGQTPGNVPWNQRADYIQLSVSLYVFSGSLTLSRSGNLYGSAGISRGYPNPVRGLGVSVNSANLLKQCPTRDQQAAAADKQITGLSYSATAHALIGGGYEYSPGTGGAVLFGFGTGVEVSPGTVGSGPIIQTGWGW